MLIRIVNNTDGCSIVSKISILHKLKIVSIIAATISVHPFKLNFNSWRFILILWWSAWISGWWFYLTNERFNSHELITRCLNIIIKFAPSILSFVSFKIFLFLFSRGESLPGKTLPRRSESSIERSPPSRRVSSLQV